MVKKSKKSKSKRTPLRKKYKILKKVKEHHKKKAKEAKKFGKSGKTKEEKDPGIPNAWPFREQELQALEVRRAKALEDQEQKNAARKERIQRVIAICVELSGADDGFGPVQARKRKLGLLDEDEEAMVGLAKDAAKRGSEFETTKRGRTVESTSAPAEGSRRAFYKEFQKVIEAADVVIQVLDARDPLGSRCLDVERMVLKSGATKRIILLLNKIDLIPKEVAEKWLKYLREELPTVAFKCSTQQQRINLGRKSSKSKEVPTVSQTSDCLGAETLLQLLKNYSRNQKLKTAITVGVVGFPNVGKSSLINSLKRTRVATVGATPGVTKVMQEIHLDKKVKLLDSPGIVFASSKADEASVTLRNCTRIEQLQDPFTPVKEILRLCSEEKLMSVYRIPKFNGVDELLYQVALVRGKLKKGGVPNTLTAARVVLHDWNEGKIPYYTLTPERHSSDHLESAIVGEWGKEFDLTILLKDESAVLANLSTLASSLHSEITASRPFSINDSNENIEEDMREAEGDEEEDEDENEDEDESDEDDDDAME